MAHPTLVEILYARNEFLVKFACLLLRQPLMLDDVVKELPAGRVLHDHEEILLGLDDL